MAYQFVTGATNAPDVIIEENQIKQILYWCGFVTPANQTAIYGDSIQEYADLMTMTESDITDVAKDYAGRATNARINFGLRKIKKLKAVTHWVKDHRRVSTTPTIEKMSGNEFRTQLETATARAQIRKQLKDDSTTKSKEASPGALKSELKWIQWETKFNNYLTTIPGVDGVPLSYVIREKEQPDAGTTFTSFVEKTVASAPLKGTFYEADSDTVHQAIVSFTTGETSENWIKSVSRHRDGRKSMQALRDHFSGEGNVTRRIAEADRLKENLHYKNERSLSFESFLTKCENMFNIYEKHGEAMTEDAKIRFLFKNVQHPELKSEIAALKASITTSPPGTLTYTTVCNHLSTAVSQLPEYTSKGRNISGVSVGDGSPSIYKSDGSIKVDEFIPNWKDLSTEDKRKVLAERKKLKIKLGSGGKGKITADTPKQLSKYKKQNAKYKRTIKALKKSVRFKDNDEGKEDDDAEEQDAGDQFGGKNAKKQKRNND